MTRRRAVAIVVAASALPRLVLLLHERGAILDEIEKSNTLAHVFLETGTFGYVPGEPSAYTQPLYGWFLIAVYWIAGEHWWSLGPAQILIAVATALVVFEIGRRLLTLRAGLVAAVVATLQPYLIWHDIHGNREILDQLLGASIFLLALLAQSRRSYRVVPALGIVTGVAILSNTRLIALPLVLGGYLLWRRAGWAAAVAVPVLAAVALAPWVVRNRVEVGCWAITTDARALWKANNPNTYRTLRSGLWLDQVPDIPQRLLDPPLDRWRTAQEAGDIYVNHHRKIDVHECAQEAYYEHLVFQYWKRHPGGKVKLAAQATEMLWTPKVGVDTSGGGSGGVRKWVEVLYVVPLYLLALAGLFLVARPFAVLAAAFIAYETAAAWVFAGTTRYRVPWDFVLALLAAAALERVWSSPLWRRRSTK